MEDIKQAVNTPQSKGKSTDEAVKTLDDTWKMVKPADKQYKGEKVKKALKPSEWMGT